MPNEELLQHTAQKSEVFAKVVNTASLPADMAVDSVGQVIANRKGCLLIQQADLERTYDTVTLFDAMSNTVSTSAITGLTTSSTTVLPANEARIKAYIQVVGATNHVVVKLGTGASTTSYNYALRPASGANQGDGGSVEIRNWRGDISACTIAGTNNVVVWELTV